MRARHYAFGETRSLDHGGGARTLKTGRLTRALSGIKFSARQARLTDGRLAPRLAFVRPGSPAALAGLRPGDHIVRAGGNRIRRPADFRLVMNRQRAPFVLAVVIDRDGARMRTRLRIRRLKPGGLTPAKPN